MTFYSKSTNGFYNESIHGARIIKIVDPAFEPKEIEQIDTDPETGETLDRYMVPNPDAPMIEVPNQDSKIPADAVEITNEYHSELMAGQSQGKRIEANESGYPVLVDPPAESLQEVRARALADIRTQRKPILDALAGIGFDALFASDEPTVVAVSEARQAALAVTELPAFLAAQTYQEMKLAIMAEYKRIAANAPTAVQTAFREVLG
ncbi:hypothetical protein EDC30_102208 [Paucimonas lemoignei]|uniref:Uncharacterized protein n=1 Tax=Paucimonas lemoignei TaxID=29443 RepID=A0A4R3I3H0_PAULE|nr:hypothetical protein [Paucimonas lemoignei]TCS38469.1 hypothetical protein EDC30_102208 [Paucimonas lemoignei]